MSLRPDLPHIVAASLLAEIVQRTFLCSPAVLCIRGAIYNSEKPVFL